MLTPFYISFHSKTKGILNNVQESIDSARSFLLIYEYIQ